MSTIPVRCPLCGEWLRVAVQPSLITPREGQLVFKLNEEILAHTCKKKDDEPSHP
jgi:hypothetical protein